MSTSTSPFLFVPVRHHSPACAHLIQRLFAERRPSRVLIEGPSDFNDRLDELLLPHRLPIAIYSFVHTETERSGAYYPFCEYSPEWQAIQLAGAAKIPFSFIDLPWGALDRSHTNEIAPERYADGALRRSTLITTLCKKLGVEDFDALWDTLFEIEPDPSPEALLARLTDFCTALRTADEDTDAVSASDLAREVFMRTCLAEAQALWRDGDGPILVVTGGYHTAALLPPHPPPGGGDRMNPIPYCPPVGRGLGGSSNLALTPYSYARLDSLTGYASGMPSPGFYHALWHGQKPLPLAVGALRKKKQPVSTADLITAEAMAQGLAALRGHARVWRTDLLDGARSALVKDSFEGEVHPLMAALFEAFRGGERGKLAAGTRLPPLTLEIQEALRNEALTPDVVEKHVHLSLLDTQERQKSQLLHQLVGLRIPGLTRVAGTDFAAREDLSQPKETWKLLWSPDFDGACIEAALYGATIPEAAVARLTERAE
ncbi:DUF5682 family protein, partial [Armatimonas sp.]|uniref:DUF5682 family protein n=1 Tax=Armatimonas sp. TaxID=1872638 RepID=UPI00286A81E7